MHARGFLRFLFISTCLVGLVLAASQPVSGSLPAQAGGTIIQVNTSSDDPNDNNTCSLRKAIRAANSDAPVDQCPAGNGVDTIRVPAGFYLLNTSEFEDEDGLIGDLNILQSVIIEGAGKDKTFIQPNESENTNRVVHIHAGAVVEMRDLQIRRGNLKQDWEDSKAINGGGIYNAGSLRLRNVIFMDNHAKGNADWQDLSAGYGGAIYNSGNLEITDTRFINNNAERNGGAISNYGTLTVLRGYFSGHSYSGGGAIENAQGAQATITATNFVENNYSGAGAIDQKGQMTLRESEFWRNVGGSSGVAALRNSGDLVIEDSLFSGNETTFDAGAILQTAGTLTIRRTTFTENFGVVGGALVIVNTEGTLVEDSLFKDNSAYHGGGVRQLNGPTTILNSTFEGNGTYSGAAIQVNGSSVHVSGCAIYGNGSSMDEGGGTIYSTGELLIENTTIHANDSWDTAGVVVNGGSTVLVNTTITNNRSSGIEVNSGSVTVRSSIIAGNESNQQDCRIQFAGQLISQGFNLLGTTNDCVWSPAQGDLLGSASNPLDPGLGALADNGGPTLTRALLPGSPAIDAGGPTCPATDQRGIPRPAGEACDIGAYELAAAQQELDVFLYLPIISR